MSGSQNRTFFKYMYGYVSIDESNIYFSSTGNGTELSKLTEKGRSHQKKKSIRLFKYWIFIGLIGLIVCYLILTGQTSYGIPLSLIASICIGGIAVFQYFRTNMGDQFLIPRNKLLEIELEQNSALIRFINVDGEEDCVTISGIPVKGKDILERLLLNQEA